MGDVREVDGAEATMRALTDDDSGVSMREKQDGGTIKGSGERVREPTTRS
ncbi:unnamed protein product [Musa acuminata subsp. burmannicoides]